MVLGGPGKVMNPSKSRVMAGLQRHKLLWWKIADQSAMLAGPVASRRHRRSLPRSLRVPLPGAVLTGVAAASRERAIRDEAAGSEGR